MAGDGSTAEIAADYNVSKATIRDWTKKYGEKFQYKHTTAKRDESDSVMEIRGLNLELKEKEKEIEFLKKAATFFAKEID